MAQHHTGFLNQGFDIDLRWCVERLKADHLLTERDANLVLTTTRSRGSPAHPLAYIAEFSLKQATTDADLTLGILLQWLAEKSHTPVYRIDPLKVQVPVLTRIMSLEFAERNHILAVYADESRVIIGTDQPFNTGWRSNLEHVIRPRALETVLLSPDQLSRYQKEFYQVTRAIAGAQSDSTAEQAKGVEALLQLGDMQNPDANDQHIVRIVDWLLQYAFDQRASDIHIEPKRESGLIRFRIDGVLHTVYDMPQQIVMAVVARIKILGRMNVAEKRKPQDGRLKTRTPAGFETELRLSTLPVAFGEKLVMRIFDPEVLVRTYHQLGLTGEDLRVWEELSRHPNGILLVTGPTGSGKTTTLYSTLKHLASPDINVCTIEDPIEMIEASFNQLQVNPAVELGFAEGVRALMRQDPDIIMIGEIRDQQTADMAIQAALTGHLVLSTVHTNDAPSALTRLHDLGVQPFLTSSTILGVMAQRLIRSLCPNCREKTATDLEAWQKLVAPWKAPPPPHVYMAKGCEECRHTGYRGRLGIYELLRLDADFKALVSQNAPLEKLKSYAYANGLQPLRLAGARKIAEGLTTFEEVIRVAPFI